ncbi:hypothetical protein QYM36_014140 [Artemia franciscana]|uniref:DEAD/DEAH-box helicase domain-containing protein n=1 Tax=Artemia franciscana TaxID=6661 RepID=A0AA88HGB8_ARTSF|nr:hypothetical protein QYM36_014140 [Artemia franciscana]
MISSLLREQSKKNLMSSFMQISLNGRFYLGIITHSFEKPHYAQQRALFPCVEEKDVKSEAKSGSGRISAASIYALNQIEIQDGSCQVVVMTPSCQREKQIRSLIPGFGFYMHAKCLVTRLENETKNLKTYNESSPHIVVGTPDIFCIIGQGALDNENIKLLSRTRDFRNPIKRNSGEEDEFPENIRTSPVLDFAFDKESHDLE